MYMSIAEEFFTPKLFIKAPSSPALWGWHNGTTYMQYKARGNMYIHNKFKWTSEIDVLILLMWLSLSLVGRTAQTFEKSSLFWWSVSELYTASRIMIEEWENSFISLDNLRVLVKVDDLGRRTTGALSLEDVIALDELQSLSTHSVIIPRSPFVCIWSLSHPGNSVISLLAQYFYLSLSSFQFLHYFFLEGDCCLHIQH